MELLENIIKKKVKVSVVGLGYVGLPLAVEFVKAGFSVLGLELDHNRAGKVRRGISYIEDVPQGLLKRFVKAGKLNVYSDYKILGKADIIIMCVPTPMRKSKEPDVSYVLGASRKIAEYMRRDDPQLIVLESTTYPGTTEELILPVLSSGGRTAGRDFFLAYSPERVDPGNEKYGTRDIPKVVGGVTPESLSMISALYNKVFKKVVPVSSTKVAETIKLLENTFRTVNIALVDEIALMCHKMGIDVWEVIRGAATKPFGFMPFYPGPGVGGACLPKDPIYLAWRAKMYDFSSRFVELASDITTHMPAYVVSRVKEVLKNRLNKPIKRAKILVLGVAYKPDLGDTRDSPSLEIMKIFKKSGAKVSYNDPCVPEIAVNGKRYRSVKIAKKTLAEADIVVLTTVHSAYNLSVIVENARLLFDTRGATWDIAKERTNVARL